MEESGRSQLALRLSPTLKDTSIPRIQPEQTGAVLPPFRHRSVTVPEGPRFMWQSSAAGIPLQQKTGPTTYKQTHVSYKIKGFKINSCGLDLRIKKERTLEQLLNAYREGTGAWGLTSQGSEKGRFDR